MHSAKARIWINNGTAHTALCATLHRLGLTPLAVERGDDGLDDAVLIETAYPEAVCKTIGFSAYCLDEF